MQSKAGMVRVDISGGTRENVAEVRRWIENNRGVLRTAPLVLPGDRISLAVVTDMSADEIARIIRSRSGDLLQNVIAGERVVVVRYADVERSGDAIIHDLEERIEWIERQLGDMKKQPAGTRQRPAPRRERPMHR
jgi:hypothetical protein